MEVKKFDMGYVLLSFVRDKGKGSPRWRKWQGYNNRNLAQVVFDRCEEKEVDIFTITSAYLGFPTGPHDRFGVLKKEAKELKSAGYDSESFGENSFVIQKGRHTVYVVKSQLVCANLNGQRRDFWTVGVPYVDCTKNKPNFEHTARDCGKEGIVLTNPSGLFGLPPEKEYTGLFDGVIASAEAGRKKNLETRSEIANLNTQRAKLNIIGISGCHLPQGIGLGHTYVNVDVSNETALFSSLKAGFKSLQHTHNYIENPGLLYQAKWMSCLAAEIGLAKLR